jgi:hypothetical protein
MVAWQSSPEESVGDISLDGVGSTSAARRGQEARCGPRSCLGGVFTQRRKGGKGGGARRRLAPFIDMAVGERRGQGVRLGVPRGEGCGGMAPTDGRRPGQHRLEADGCERHTARRTRETGPPATVQDDAVKRGLK